MASRVRALALWCAVACAVASAAAYTIDCNHDYTDCETEFGKLAINDGDPLLPLSSEIVTERAEPVEPITSTTSTTTTTTTSTTTTTQTPSTTSEPVTTTVEANEVPDSNSKPKPRLLNLNVDELQNFANILHNQTESKNSKKFFSDLSDVDLDAEDDEDTSLEHHGEKHIKIPDKFYSNLQEPFHPMLNVDRSDESETCIDNGITHKIGDKIDRGCDETCECTPGGQLECAPRCQSPFIRRGRRLNDPLCFESPVDECCSIIACATGNDAKTTSVEVCHYNNITYTVGSKWNVGCEQTCTCEKDSVVTCKPRCNRLPQSEKCINVQDPKDECCEVQVCDVSQDDHEEVLDNANSTTEAPKERNELAMEKSTMRPLVLIEPIGSIKVLHNNSVQVNLMHANNSDDPIHLQLSDNGGLTYDDIELKYSNLILNLKGGKNYILKTKETGTKFNFTITSTDGNEGPMEELKNKTKFGCYHDNKYYEVGEEFQIGCSEICECTGQDTKECAPMVCPSHVGLEIVSKSCVQWAPNPPPVPPNCCPRTARCLSDGTCHYKGVPVPNWSKVPIELTGCEEHCFCENGELDCQEVCSPLPPLPPQNLRCPPMHRPAPMNVSDEDCCKEWGCVPHAGLTNGSSMPPISTRYQNNYVTPNSPILSHPKFVLPIPQMPTESAFNKQVLAPFKYDSHNNIKSATWYINNGPFDFQRVKIPKLQQTNSTERPIKQKISVFHNINPSKLKYNDFANFVNFSEPVGHNIQTSPIKPLEIKSDNVNPKQTITITPYSNKTQSSSLNIHDFEQQSSLKKVPLSQIDDLNLFLPSYDKKLIQKLKDNNESKTLYFDTDLPNNIASDHDQPLNLSLVTPINNTKFQVKPMLNTNSNKNKPESQKFKPYVWTENLDPYDTVLLRPITNVKMSKTMLFPYKNEKLKSFQKPYSALDLEQILKQMEVESEVSMNMERSANKLNRSATAAVPPDNNHYPQEEIPDYDQNNVHRPVHPLDPALAGLPPGLHITSGDDNKRLSVLSLQGDSPTSIKMLFGLPSVLVGLKGSIDLRYTDTDDPDISQWYSQVFAPADEVLTTPRLEFRLTGLKPSTTYKIRGKLYLHSIPVEPESEILTVRTQDLPTIATVEEKRREIDCKLMVLDVNDTTAHLAWRHFTEDELMLIDGIQVRYRSTGSPLYSMTELLHHSRSTAELTDLRPGSTYEASLVLMPPPRATTELFDSGKVEFTTAPYIDPYNWTVEVEAREVGAEAVELTWRGVPMPAEKWVRVYRAAHDCGDRHDHDAFRLATRDSQPAITLTGLEADTNLSISFGLPEIISKGFRGWIPLSILVTQEIQWWECVVAGGPTPITKLPFGCRVWLDLFLTNGKVKTSNVLEIHTKSLDSPENIDNVIESSSIARGPARGDYYGALVVVGVVAALAALAAVLLLLVVVRRHRPRSVQITSVPSAPRESSLPPYDNPAYKLEIQQETMDL